MIPNLVSLVYGDFDSHPIWSPDRRPSTSPPELFISTNHDASTSRGLTGSIERSIRDSDGDAATTNGEEIAAVGAQLDAGATTTANRITNTQAAAANNEVVTIDDNTNDEASRMNAYFAGFKLTQEEKENLVELAVSVADGKEAQCIVTAFHKEYAECPRKFWNAFSGYSRTENVLEDLLSALSHFESSSVLARRFVSKKLYHTVDCIAQIEIGNRLDADSLEGGASSSEEHEEEKEGGKSEFSERRSFKAIAFQKHLERKSTPAERTKLRYGEKISQLESGILVGIKQAHWTIWERNLSLNGAQILNGYLSTRPSFQFYRNLSPLVEGICDSFLARDSKRKPSGQHEGRKAIRTTQGHQGINVFRVTNTPSQVLDGGFLPGFSHRLRPLNPQRTPRPPFKECTRERPDKPPNNEIASNKNHVGIYMDGTSAPTRCSPRPASSRSKRIQQLSRLEKDASHLLPQRIMRQTLSHNANHLSGYNSEQGRRSYVSVGEGHTVPQSTPHATDISENVSPQPAPAGINSTADFGQYISSGMVDVAPQPAPARINSTTDFGQYISSGMVDIAPQPAPARINSTTDFGQYISSGMVDIAPQPAPARINSTTDFGQYISSGMVDVAPQPAPARIDSTAGLDPCVSLGMNDVSHVTPQPAPSGFDGTTNPYVFPGIRDAALQFAPPRVGITTLPVSYNFSSTENATQCVF
ncbi:conserved hypothetical protein [Histoplasma capsulatum var. duboisii H88]|uniref:Uncharacterized protein n=1 Tax=Ajellomyces capsulatus (strain H88) TaxID=544711 RepID=F0UGS2_AJEC8|nr:conserved hypothetical protein [Histoplasma capsulatum var. duboisii H88]